ncbi:hypothetical protein UT4_05340 [Ferrigenium sp. UT4]
MQITRNKYNFRFIDLFAGVGGFHVALSRLGGQCVFASEIDLVLQSTYKENFGLTPSGDLKQISPNAVPDHEVLCAGFPCQPFSKAGEQLGFECDKQGDLFQYVAKIISAKKPAFFILENVPNLLKHNGGETYRLILKKLKSLQYDVDERRLSPHHFGIPQIRDRVYIIGARHGLSQFSWPEERTHELNICDVLEANPTDARPLSSQVTKCLETWNEFIQKAPSTVELPSFPIWSMEFGADYPFEGRTPWLRGGRGLVGYKGSHGVVLRELKPHERLAALPSYARTQEEEFPLWKQNFIRQNREFYLTNKKWIDPWLPKILKFPPSLQKFEWNIKGGERDVWKYVIQFRASGVRLKRATTAPSLVAMTTTQVPIIAWERRYMTTRECANLQSLGSLRKHPLPVTKAYKAFGNAVNADVVEAIARQLLREYLSVSSLSGEINKSDLIAA